MCNGRIHFLLLMIVAIVFVGGCSKPRTEVTYGTIVKCQQCGKVVKRDVHTKSATVDEARGLKLVTQASYCADCSNRMVKLKTGAITTCEDCGKILSRNVRTVSVKFRDRGGYSVSEKTGLCRACRQAREPLPYTVVSTSDASFGDFGDTEGKSRTVYRVRLRVSRLPTEQQMRRTAVCIWEKECGSEDESVIFMYLPGMNTEDMAYGIAEYTSSEMSRFEVQGVALMGTKWDH